MNAADTLVNAIPLLVITVLGGWLLKGRLTRLERKIDSLPTREEFNAMVHRIDRQDGRFDRQDARFDRQEDRFDRLETKLDSVRSDITQIAIALGTQTRPQAG